MIANDFSFWEIVWTMSIYLPVFYWLIVPWLIFISSNKKKKRIKILKKKIEDFNNSLDKYTKENNLENYKFPEELIEEYENENNVQEKMEQITWDLYHQLKEKNYKFIVKANEDMWKYFYREIEDEEIQWMFCFVVGTAYQEVWSLKYANIYFDVFLDNLMLNNKVIKNIEKSGIKNIDTIKMIFLVKELQELWLSYKVKNKSYYKKK